jgi:cytochrome o ubiquinol oxidase operon protein cyoD
MSTVSNKSTPKHEEGQATLSSYVIGYIISVYLTVTAYLLVRNHMNSHAILLSLIIGLALVQFIVQLLFFLHLGRETKPRWKLLVFSFMIVIVCIIVFGSLWIMDNLNYRMTPSQMNTYMNDQSGDL